MIQLIVSDMDGTLLNDRMEISQGNIQAIEEAQRRGIPFMVATGRGYDEAVPALREAGIECPLITVNGGQVFDADGSLIDNIGIDKNRTRNILEIVQSMGLYAELVTATGVYTDDKLRRIDSMTTLLKRTNPDTTFKMALILAMARLEMLHINYIDDFKGLLDDDQEQVLKVLVFSDVGQEELAPVREQLKNDKELVITSSFYNNLEINHVQAQKGIALERFANGRGIPLEHVMAIGDNFNDVSMLDKVGYSFAVANAEPEVKQHARYHVSTNSENGVAEAILRCLQEEQ